MQKPMTSRVSGKGQITLPKGIREKLGVRAGDALVCEMEGKTIRIRKAEPLDLAWHEAISQHGCGVGLGLRPREFR